jgi:NAD(P)-dependent dehydrogenase (short-subunit alcohol dehydrogenase family)
VVINNAGILCRRPVLALELDDWRRVLDVNLLGVVRGCKTLAALLVPQQRGQLVNIASSTGLLPPSKLSAYSASKAGVIALSETLAQELAPFNIGVTVVCPSYFESNMHERVVRDDLTSDDIAKLIYDAVESNELMVIPHSKVRRAWQDKVRAEH